MQAEAGDPPAAFDDLGRFVMKDFDKARPFASFLPGLGGIFGVPMWAFYVNRGQAMAAFGTENKQHPIQEFNPANKAYQQTADSGFRTFLRLSRGESEDFSVYQPFYPRSEEAEESAVQRDMLVGMNEVEIVETNAELGLKTAVNYFSIPEEKFAALVRTVTFTNTHESETLNVEALDGLAKLQPFGVTDWHLKNMGRTLEGWFEAFNFDESEHTLPYFKLTASVVDSEEVSMVEEGNWAVAFVDEPGAVMDGSMNEALPFIADPTMVFGQLDSAMKNPLSLDSESVPDLLKRTQVTLARTPCAFAASTFSLPPGESLTITSVYGRAKTMDTFTQSIAPKVLQKGFIASKRNIALSLTDSITKLIQTSTADPIFDAMVRQMFLDNVLRGGYPVLLGADADGENNRVYHTFNRIHGDLERDYNNFQLDLTYFSQGPGNFRDVNQNRRLDVMLVPEVRDFNVRTFLSFVQADGYSPLTVATAQFVMEDDAVEELIASFVEAELMEGSDGSVQALTGLLNRPFRAGNLFEDISLQGIEIGMGKMEFIDRVAAVSTQVPQANMTVNGNWADHWTYTLDLVENFLSVYPDEEEWLLYDSDPVPFYLSQISVQPRDKKYVLSNPKKHTVRQYGCAAFDGVKIKYFQTHETDVNSIWLRVGQLPEGFDEIEDSLADYVGDIFTVSPIAKLTLLAVSKFVLLDPLGMGVEMDGGKPGWNDAMNGLPGMIGSGMPETFELLRTLRFLLGVQKYGRSVDLPAELDTLINTVMESLDSSTDDFTYWDTVATAREEYRVQTDRLISGDLVTWSEDELSAVLEKMITKVEAGVKRALAMSGDETPTYFYYKVTDYELVKDEAGVVQHDAVNRPNVRALAFEVGFVPQFLEGPVRHFKILTERAEKEKLYQQVKASKMYDSKLGLYKICEPLKGMSFEIGRMMAFAPGWLENESVWLHMSYKYYLELLRAGLYDEFWAEAQVGLSSFMDPEVYGRSPLEAASFIVSSAYPDDRLHGSGFLARLSGSTAEFLSMWALMFQGPKPFFVNDDGELNLRFEPALPSWLFNEEDTVTFMFLGAVKVSIVNADGGNTWEGGPLSTAVITMMDGSVEELDLEDGVVPAPYAEMIRDRTVASIAFSF